MEENSNFEVGMIDHILISVYMYAHLSPKCHSGFHKTC